MCKILNIKTWRFWELENYLKNQFIRKNLLNILKLISFNQNDIPLTKELLLIYVIYYYLHIRKVILKIVLSF